MEYIKFGFYGNNLIGKSYSAGSLKPVFLGYTGLSEMLHTVQVGLDRVLWQEACSWARAYFFIK